MRKIPMAALAAPVHKSGFFQVGYQLSHFARHFSINLVSQLFKAVKSGHTACRFHFSNSIGITLGKRKKQFKLIRYF
jgi:hypothetical protein